MALDEKIERAKAELSDYKAIENFIDMLATKYRLSPKIVDALKEGLVIKEEFFTGFVTALKNHGYLSANIVWKKIYFQVRTVWFLMQKLIRDEKPVVLVRNPHYDPEYTEFIFIDFKKSIKTDSFFKAIREAGGTYDRNYFYTYELFGQ